MRRDKVQALKLRLAGKSYTEISNILGVPKSTLSAWFFALELSAKARERLEKRVHAGSLRGLIKRNKNQTRLARERMLNIRKSAKTEIHKPTLENIKLIGVALYWAEGYKRSIIRNGKEVTYHSVALTNSDPGLIRLFLKFLREVCNVSNEKITAEIRMYEHMSKDEVLKFWQKTTGLPVQNFRKNYYGVSRSSQGKRPFNRLPHGTLMIRVNNTNLFHKIMGWIEGVSSMQ